MQKKLLTILLASLASLALFSCAKQEEKKTDDKKPADETVVSDETETEAETGKEDAEEIDYESDLSEEKYDGYTFRMLIRPGYISDEYVEEDSDDPVQSAIYKRNKLVEERFGITITATESSTSDYETDALNSILAGDDAYDVVFPHSRAAFSYAVQGAFYNLHDISTLHLDKPWWSQDIVDSCTVNGKLYVLDGDISTKRLQYAFALLFNKRIFDELGYEYPYQMVKDGEWTFDQFAYLAKKGGADLNGDGVLTFEDDQFGYVSTPYLGPIAILYTSGTKIVDKGESGLPELALYSNKAVSLFDDFFNLLSNNNCYMNVAGGVGETFQAGRAMFGDGGPGDLQSWRGMDDDFGILPYPKYTEEEEYATITNGCTHLLGIPITVSDVERTGAIVEALCAYGARDVLPAYYDVSLKTKYSRDNDSEEMLDIIKDSIVYDLGYVAGISFQSCGRDLAVAPNHDFASYYTSQEDAAKASVDTFNHDYGDVEID